MFARKPSHVSLEGWLSIVTILSSSSTVILMTVVSASSFPSTPACPHPVDLPFGVGCVCTFESCGTYPIDPVPPSTSQALVITTSPQHGFFHHATVDLDGPLASTNSTKEEDEEEGNKKHNATMKLTIDPTTEYQEIIGFGAAITDAASYVLTDLFDSTHKNSSTSLLMDQVLRQAFVHANFSISRVPMNAADFSRMDYSLAHELDLTDFCLRDDRQTLDTSSACEGQDYKLDILERIVQLYQPELKVIVASWSAPPSFKTQNFTCVKNNKVIIECTHDPEATAPAVECVRTVSDPAACLGQPLGVPCETTPPHNYTDGYPINPGLERNYNPDNVPHKNADGNCYHTGFIREDAYEAWANLFAKFIEAYAQRSVTVWGVSSQNEPYTQTGLWNSNFWTADTLVSFVNDYLAPAVRKVQPEIKVLTYDDQLINLTDAAKQIAMDTMDASDGIAYHWYSSMESIFENNEAGSPVRGLNLPFVGGGAGVKTLYDLFNGTKFMLMTESCSGYTFGSKYIGPQHGSLAYGYNTAHDVLWQLRNRGSGYVYWNLILDSLGGPNKAGNYVDSPMYSENSTAFVMNPPFFYLAHFSRAVRPGSVAIEANVECGASHNDYCQFVAFRTPQDNIVVVMTNDEVTTNLVYPMPLPRLAKGEGAPIGWTIQCGKTTFSGILPWQGIQTVILPICQVESPADTTSAAATKMRCSLPLSFIVSLLLCMGFVSPR